MILSIISHNGLRADANSGMSRAKAPIVALAVIRRDGVEVVGRAQAARSRHVLHHDRRMARNIAADVPRNQSGAEIVAAAGPVADDQVDGPVALEIRDRVGMRGHRQRGEESISIAAAGRVSIVPFRDNSIWSVKDESIFRSR